MVPSESDETPEGEGLYGVKNSSEDISETAKIAGLEEIRSYMSSMMDRGVVNAEDKAEYFCPESINYLYDKGVLPYLYDREGGELVVMLDGDVYGEFVTGEDLQISVPEFFSDIIPSGMRARGVHSTSLEVRVVDKDIMSKLLPYVKNPSEVEDYVASVENKGRVEDAIHDEHSVPNQIVNRTLRYFMKRGATDVHFEATGSKFRARGRIDGELEEYPKAIKDVKTYQGVVAVIKNRCNMKIEEKRRSQDGRMTVQSALIKDGKSPDFDLRVSTAPVVSGFENVVLRVMERGAFKGLEDLGFPAYDLERVQAVCDKPKGMVLVTGPTGSGKTTTQYAILNKLNTIDRKIITAEDPVEIRMDGLQQVQMNDAIGISFSNYLRHALRQDPDVLLIGEIRDPETAEIATQASMTGHLVLSTLHANSSTSAPGRMLEMGVSPLILADNLEGVVSQRLVRKFSPTYIQKIQDGNLTEDDLKLLKVMDGGEFLNNLMGEDCYPLGQFHVFGASDTPVDKFDPDAVPLFSGREAMIEYWDIEDSSRDAIGSGHCSRGELEADAIKTGMRPMFISGIEKILTGETSPDKVLRWTGKKTFIQHKDYIKKFLSEEMNILLKETNTQS
ncbi:type II/IV secretion system protein [archaeon]|nr:type II/IV secretion system protein [archaeon]